MPKQIGIIKIKGSIDDLSFYEGQDGQMVRKKARFNKDKLKNDPNYSQTRKVNQEFAIGGTATRIFREAFTAEITRVNDNRMGSRLTKAMIEILQTDQVNEWGYRQVQEGDIAQLQNFNFNDTMPFLSTVKLQISGIVNRASGEVTISIPAHVPMQFITAPSNATHYRFFAAAAQVDFESGQTFSVRQTLPNRPYDDNEAAVTQVILSMAPDSTLPVFVLLGVEFSKMVNGKAHSNSKKESSLVVLLVDATA